MILCFKNKLKEEEGVDEGEEEEEGRRRSIVLLACNLSSWDTGQKDCVFKFCFVCSTPHTETPSHE